MLKHYKPSKHFCKTIRNQIPEESQLEGRGRNPIPYYNNAIYVNTPGEHVVIES